MSTQTDNETRTSSYAGMTCVVLRVRGIFKRISDSTRPSLTFENQIISLFLSSNNFVKCMTVRKKPLKSNTAIWLSRTRRIIFYCATVCGSRDWSLRAMKHWWLRPQTVKKRKTKKKLRKHVVSR